MPEVLKVSRTESSSEGGKELFVLGKNFLKDSRVVFQGRGWKQEAIPDKEFLQPVGLHSEPGDTQTNLPNIFKDAFGVHSSFLSWSIFA
jgi:Rel homology dimerisation domain